MTDSTDAAPEDLASEPGADASSDTTADDLAPDATYALPIDPFDALIDEALDRLPEPFRSQLGSVAIVVEDWPTSAQLAAVDARGLYGLYQGIPRTTFGADGIGVPSKITIFRGPLEARYRTPDSLRDAVFDVVRHEVAHHFGISDARLAELQRR